MFPEKKMHASWIAFCAVTAAITVTTLTAGAQQNEGPILLPSKPVNKPASATLLVLCDLACNWKLDGEAMGHIDAGASAKAKVELGQHMVVAVTEDGADQIKQLSEVKSTGQTVVSIELQPVRDARLKLEQEAQNRTKAAIGATLLVMCDLACNWRLDGETMGRIEGGSSAKAKVEVGQHMVVGVTEDGADQIKQVSEVKSTGQTVVSIELQPVRDARLKAEQMAKAALQEMQAKAEQAAKEKAEAEAQENAALEEQKKKEEEREQIARDEASDLVWVDRSTGLMWPKADNGSGVDWEDAQTYCRSLELEGHSDWRMATTFELQGLSDQSAPKVYCGYGNHCHIKGDIRLSSPSIWSSTNGNQAGKYIFVNFSFGLAAISYPMNRKMGLRVLCVRRFGEGTGVAPAPVPQATPAARFGSMKQRTR
jgi:hypothetical protein